MYFKIRLHKQESECYKIFCIYR